MHNIISLHLHILINSWNLKKYFSIFIQKIEKFDVQFLTAKYSIMSKMKCRSFITFYLKWNFFPRFRQRNNLTGNICIFMSICMIMTNLHDDEVGLLYSILTDAKLFIMKINSSLPNLHTSLSSSYKHSIFINHIYITCLYQYLLYINI